MNTSTIDEIKNVCSLTKDQMSFGERVFITNELVKIKCENLLIFGAGHDSIFWSKQSKNTYILEHDKKWLDNISNNCKDVNGLQFFFAEYATFATINECAHAIRCNSSKLDINIHGLEPSKIKWDAIIVDAPTGYRPTNELFRGGSIRLANNLANKGCLLFIHDTDRILEQFACMSFLKRPPVYNIDRLNFYIK